MDKPTKVLLDERAREAIWRGVAAIYEPVRRTLGPEGGNALMYRTFNRGSRITNDGKAIADVIEPLDEFENLAAKAFKEATDKTNEKAGDGTTTTTVIGGHLINEIFRKLSESSSSIRTKTAGGKVGVMRLRREMQEAVVYVIEAIKQRAKKVESLEELEKIAVVSVEDVEIGKIVAKMAWEVGVDGFVDVTDGHKGEIEVEVIKGMRIPAKVGAKAFVNNPARFEMIAADIPCLVTNYALDNAAQVNAFTGNLQTAKLAIFAPSFSENVLVGMVAAFKQGFHIYPIATPGLRTEQYEDLAVYIGANFINKDTGRKLQNIKEADLGFAEKIVVKDSDAKEDATVIGGRGTQEGTTKVNGEELKVASAVSDRITTLQAQMEIAPSEMQRKSLERRVASISAAVGIIRVGASSQAEGLYKKLKIEDAVYACKAALQEGYVRGGGLCLKEVAEELPESILTSCLKAPYEQIQANAEGELEIGEDIIDPAKVVRLAVEHAVSVAAHLATAKIIIPEMRDKAPSEGYEEIAKAILKGVRYWAIQQGLVKENQDEMDRDNVSAYEKNLFEHGNG
jgi:chaperonin GroEL